MKKLFTLILVALVSVSAFSVNITGGTKLYLKPNSNWRTDGARFAAYYYGDGDAWVSMTFIENHGGYPVYEAISPAGKNFTNVIFCRMKPSDPANNWGNKLNQTNNLTYDGTNNCFQVASGTWDGATTTWSVYTPPVVLTPSVVLTVPASVFLDQTISLNATPSNVDNPVITYSVKVPGSESFVVATSPYQPTVTGTYTFKAEVTENGSGPVLATDTKDVVVKAVLDPIVIKGKVPESWTNPIHLYVFGTSSSNGFKTMTKVGDWYTYTFEYETSVNIIFVNGGDWTGGNANQTVNVENVTASACYQVNNEASGKKTVTQVVCDDDNPSVILTVPALGFVGESIVFDAISSNVDNPVISYFVKVPGSESFVAATSPYELTEIGTYTFKAEVAEDGDPTVLASDTKDVVVHAASSVVVRLKGIPTSWDANDVHVHYWSDGTGGGFIKMDKKEGYYESTFNNKINLGFLFVSGNDWSTNNMQSANAGSNVTENTCYKVNEDTDVEGKRTVEAIDCSGIVTGTVSNHLDNFTLSVSNKTITANFAGVSNVELYSMTGQLLQKVTANKQFSQTLNTGIYVLRIDGESHKVVVR